MFCTNCGQDIAEDNNFCASCGTPVDGSAASPGASADWRHAVEYRVVANHPEVTALVGNAAGMSSGGVTAEEFLDVAQKLIPAIPIPLNTLVKIVQPFGNSLGIKTGKELFAHYDHPLGRVVAATLCSLALRGQALQNGEQAADGCVVTAGLPSSVWAWSGTLLVAIQQEGDGTKVTASTAIGGQMYDWGHSKRVLQKLFDDIPDFIGKQD